MTFAPDTMPSVGDTISVEWCNETWQLGKWKAMYTGVVMSVPEDGKCASWRIYYPSNELNLYYGQHPGMTISQNLEKLSWKWAAPSDAWEYRTHCEIARAERKRRHV